MIANNVNGYKLVANGLQIADVANLKYKCLIIK